MVDKSMMGNSIFGATEVIPDEHAEATSDEYYSYQEDTVLEALKIRQTPQHSL